MRIRLARAVVLSAAMVSAVAPAFAASDTSRSPGPFRVAVTFDDLPLGAGQTDLETTRRINESILSLLAKHGIQAVGFVNEKKVYRTGEVDERIAVLKLWPDSGQELGNQTFFHPSLNLQGGTEVVGRNFQPGSDQGENPSSELNRRIWANASSPSA